MEKLTICLNSNLLYDRLHILSNEYSISTDLLVSLAIQRLLDDVDLIRSLRAGAIKLE